MKFDGYDFIFLGTGLGLGSVILFAKAYLVPSFPAESAQTFLDFNPFVARNNISTRHEAWAGLIWALLAAVAAIIGTIRTVRHGQEGYMIGSWLDIITLIAFLLVLGRITVSITDRTSRAEYLPVMVKMQSELFDKASFAALHKGINRDESSRGIEVPEHILNERLKHLSEGLDQVGKLLDEPRKHGEGDESYTRRLASYFPGVSLD